MPLGLTPVEFIAALLAFVTLIKLVVITVNKKAWYNKVAAPIYGNAKSSSKVFLVLAAIIFYYLIQELSIVQIYASLAFTSMIMGAGLMMYSKDVLQMAKKALSRKFDGMTWLYIIIFAILSIWVLNSLFFLF